MPELQRLVDDLAAQYLAGRWTPYPEEERRVAILSLAASIDGGLEGLVAGGALTGSSIAEALRPHPDLDSWRLTPVLRVYPAGDNHSRALTRDLLDAVTRTPAPAGSYIQSPAVYTGPAVFLAGGITGCPDWQTRAALQLRATGMEAAVLNPRQLAFPGGSEAMRRQIAWEHEHLHRAQAILFWFCAERDQPIALYELGAAAARGARIAVGTDAEYPRRLDVIEQLRHARPEVAVHNSLASTVRAAAALMRDCTART
ncbi:nucleoside 2-deoxyribosyltransferase domain-containing protein [Streptomyces sp. UNOC14_S4]|uniref:nucleoside 2-deoxyribosyltransferase domain-containing protein n=1 Tax=Streptomyces sp. UNOC14_S4 TaxID=2872340 RepID=UPI001E563D49|nr:nucleoside 2-deoxyribosyltransferase domain-containing protein [Streptomyces sp. UNOC14_S4]MCC3767288.1 nucleoside 2-deoxyribosyltransferase domain-containing protein [Streptomyces sp. UNOC14_S4]